jgi:hypothetical protein
MILESKEEPKPEPSNLNLEIRTGIATDTIPIYFSNLRTRGSSYKIFKPPNIVWTSVEGVPSLAG